MAPGGSRSPTTTTKSARPRGPPDGTQIAFMARIGGNDFEICVMNADGTGLQQLTNNTVPDATPSWSPDGTQIAFFRGGPVFQIFTMNPELNPTARSRSRTR